MWSFVIWVCIYFFIFNSSNFPALTILMVEMASDAALGTVFVSITAVMLFLSITIFPIFNTLGHAGFFYFFAAICACGFLFILIFVGETKGLLEREKKEQYWPGARYGRKLKSGEICKASPAVWSKATKLLQTTQIEPTTSNSSSLLSPGGRMNASTVDSSPTLVKVDS